MKTIEEWFEKLEEPYRTKALLNLKSSKRLENVESLSRALVNGFIWDYTDEGESYWNDLHTELVISSTFKN